jgi:hypothetical protein
VFIDSQLVGYIPASDAAQVRREIIAANPSELPVICKAMIRGGFMKGNKRADHNQKNQRNPSHKVSSKAALQPQPARLVQSGHDVQVLHRRATRAFARYSSIAIYSILPGW